MIIKKIKLILIQEDDNEKVWKSMLIVTIYSTIYHNIVFDIHIDVSWNNSVDCC